MSGNKKIHFISYFYPPVKAVGTLRNYFISHLFSENGYDVTVYGGNPIGYLHKDELPISPKIKVNRTIAFDYHLFDFYIKNKRAKNNKKGNTTGPTFKSYFPFNILVGEGGIVYIFFTFFRLLFHIKKIDILWTSYSPYSDHFIASLLKMIKPSIYWISDWRDVDIDVDWPQSNATKIQAKINYFFFKRSDLVVSVAKGYMSFVQKYAPKNFLLRNGIMNPYIYNHSVVDSSFFSITYVGGLYGGRRDPSPIFSALSNAINTGYISKNKIKLNYAGPEGNLFKSLALEFGLDETVVDYGVVSFDISQRLQRSSQINLMITWTSDNMNTFPAKFYEYVNAQRPILLLIDGPQDIEFEDIFEKHDLGVLVYSKDALKLNSKIISLIKKWNERSLLPIDKKDLNAFLWRAQFNDFLKMLDR